MTALEEMEADPRFKELTAPEQDEMRAGFFRKFVASDPRYVQLAPEERDTMVRNVMDRPFVLANPQHPRIIDWKEDVQKVREAAPNSFGQTWHNGMIVSKILAADAAKAVIGGKALLAGAGAIEDIFAGDPIGSAYQAGLGKDFEKVKADYMRLMDKRDPGYSQSLATVEAVTSVASSVVGSIRSMSAIVGSLGKAGLLTGPAYNQLARITAGLQEAGKFTMAKVVANIGENLIQIPTAAIVAGVGRALDTVSTEGFDAFDAEQVRQEFGKDVASDVALWGVASLLGKVAIPFAKQAAWGRRPAVAKILDTVGNLANNVAGPTEADIQSAVIEASMSRAGINNLLKTMNLPDDLKFTIRDAIANNQLALKIKNPMDASEVYAAANGFGFAKEADDFIVYGRRSGEAVDAGEWKVPTIKNEEVFRSKDLKEALGFIKTNSPDVAPTFKVAGKVLVTGKQTSARDLASLLNDSDTDVPVKVENVLNTYYDGKFVVHGDPNFFKVGSQEYGLGNEAGQFMAKQLKGSRDLDQAYRDVQRRINARIENGVVHINAPSEFKSPQQYREFMEQLEEFVGGGTTKNLGLGSFGRTNSQEIPSAEGLLKHATNTPGVLESVNFRNSLSWTSLQDLARLAHGTVENGKVLRSMEYMVEAFDNGKVKLSHYDLSGGKKGITPITDAIYDSRQEAYASLIDLGKERGVWQRSEFLSGIMKKGDVRAVVDETGQVVTYKGDVKTGTYKTMREAVAGQPDLIGELKKPAVLLDTSTLVVDPNASTVFTVDGKEATGSINKMFEVIDTFQPSPDPNTILAKIVRQYTDEGHKIAAYDPVVGDVTQHGIKYSVEWTDGSVSEEFNSLQEVKIHLSKQRGAFVNAELDMKERGFMPYLNPDGRMSIIDGQGNVKTFANEEEIKAFIKEAPMPKNGYVPFTIRSEAVSEYEAYMKAAWPKEAQRQATLIGEKRNRMVGQAVFQAFLPRETYLAMAKDAGVVGADVAYSGFKQLRAIEQAIETDTIPHMQVLSELEHRFTKLGLTRHDRRLLSSAMSLTDEALAAEPSISKLQREYVKALRTYVDQFGKSMNVDMSAIFTHRPEMIKMIARNKYEVRGSAMPEAAKRLAQVMDKQAMSELMMHMEPQEFVQTVVQKTIMSTHAQAAGRIISDTIKKLDRDSVPHGLKTYFGEAADAMAGVRSAAMSLTTEATSHITGRIAKFLSRSAFLDNLGVVDELQFKNIWEKMNNLTSEYALGFNPWGAAKQMMQGLTNGVFVGQKMYHTCLEEILDNPDLIDAYRSAGRFDAGLRVDAKESTTFGRIKKAGTQYITNIDDTVRAATIRAVDKNLDYADRAWQATKDVKQFKKLAGLSMLYEHEFAPIMKNYLSNGLDAAKLEAGFVIDRMANADYSAMGRGAALSNTGIPSLMFGKFQVYPANYISILSRAAKNSKSSFLALMGVSTAMYFGFKAIGIEYNQFLMYNQVSMSGGPLWGLLVNATGLSREGESRKRAAKDMGTNLARIFIPFYTAANRFGMAGDYIKNGYFGYAAMAASGLPMKTDAQRAALGR